MINNKLWTPIQKHIDCLPTGHMPAVHHYTRVEAALKILESGHLWFTERAHLNDKKEITLGVDECKVILRYRMGEEVSEQFNQAAKRVLEQFRFYSASFTLTSNDLAHPAHDDIKQWEDYADEGRGVVLTFNKCTFSRPREHVHRYIPDEPPATVFVTPMSYDKEKLRECIDKIINVWDGRETAELCNYIFAISSLFKGKDWESEKEYRFFIHHAHEKILRNPIHKTRDRNGELVSYLDLPIPNWNPKNFFPICRIGLGPKIPCDLKKQLYDFILSRGISLDTSIPGYWLIRGP